MKLDQTQYDTIKQQIKHIHPFINNTELAYEIILQLILEGHLQPSEKLQQEVFASFFGMSRTPIREALIRLEQDRFIEKNDSNGYHVCPLHLKDYIQFCEFRTILETQAAFQAARNITTTELKELADNITALKAAIEENNYYQIMHLDLDFHMMICKASRNDYIYKTMLQYRNKLIFNMKMAVTGYNFHALYNKHLRIYKAIRATDEYTAQQAMQGHLQVNTNRILNTLPE